ncbi:MAG: hypothetical protein RMJ17_04395 [Candidatus Aenigmarchaeota archaeon]|nr:hypothetical protein [Candidatus Aenigmarchaeota archaeon]MDW8149796.1 hypothetical protein [Candidatus Aenigmarchaeota archaeon]
MVDNYMIEEVKRIYKVKNNKLAEEIARNILIYIESRGMYRYMKRLEECFGKKYAAKTIVEKYRKSTS